MTNEEKAIEIANNDDLYNIENGCIEDCRIAALEMAKWKDEQFAKEKQKLIDEACEWLAKNDSYAKPTHLQVDRLREHLNKQ